MTWAVSPTDAELVAQGEEALRAARSQMPVLDGLQADLRASQPLRGHRISGCAHLTKQTGVLVELLAAAGAEVAWTGGNEVSTQDDVAAALAKTGVRVFGRRGMTPAAVQEAVVECARAFDGGPTLAIDSGAAMLRTIVQEPEAFPNLVAATEKTAEGSQLLRDELRPRLTFPVVLVNDVVTKWEVDNTHGTGQSTLDGILRATGAFLAGKRFVVCGYGHVGRGLARRARGMGARVTITCRSELTAIRARLDGFDVQPMAVAARSADLVCTATGQPDVVTGEHLDLLPSGAILCNTGHSVVEINLADLARRTDYAVEVGPHVQRHFLANGRHVDLLSGGGLVNLDAAEGNPSEAMDLTFTNQALAVLDLAAKAGELAPGVHEVDQEQDEEVARRKLRRLGIGWDAEVSARPRPLYGSALRSPLDHRSGSSRGGYIGGTTAFARLDLAEGSMPALAALRRDFSSSKPLAGRRLLIAGLVTAGSAVAAHTARAMGASVVWCATSARHFDREVADHLRESGCVVHDPTGAGGVRSAIRNSLAAWREGPTALLDDDAVLTTAMHEEFAEFPGPQFAVERTTRGARLIKKRPYLRFPVITADRSTAGVVASDSHAKALIDVIGVVGGEPIAGQVVAVAGYGAVGSRVAARAGGIGARVVVTEVRPTRALMAVLDGFDVLPLEEAAGIADIICTTTGRADTLREAHLAKMRTGALVVASVAQEVDAGALHRTAAKWRTGVAGLRVAHLTHERVIRIALPDKELSHPHGEPAPYAAQDISFATQLHTTCEALRESAAARPSVGAMPGQSGNYALSAIASAMRLRLRGDNPPR
ncbi:adenosylhomocysteinase [Saccharopolyspora shandongensis]|uniref:adenosylhomocysteinase n=1 Tax=Saccharopolyspora shandongensis TaxID=418495 RepID=UPI00340C0576